MNKPKKVKCPYFLSRTNGKKLFINCSTENHINKSSLRKEFNTVEARKVSYEINCCSDPKHCKNYQFLKNIKGENINENYSRI